MTVADAPEIAVRALRASYDHRVLTDVSFTVAPGSTTVVLGSPGSGKTTLLLVLLGRMAPDRGEVGIGGRSLVGVGAGELADIHGRTGVLLAGRDVGAAGRKNSPRVDDVGDGVVADASVGENLRAAAGTGSSVDERVTRWLATFDLADLETRPARELDAGARRRLALARVFVADPSLVVLDDPVATVPAADQEAVLAALARATEAGDTTVVVACSDLATAKAVGSHVVALVNGRSRKQGPADRMLRLVTSDHDYAAHFTLGGKPIAAASSASLGEHRMILGVRSTSQVLLLGAVLLVGLACLTGIVLLGILLIS